jgi:hypothetical protein
MVLFNNQILNQIIRKEIILSRNKNVDDDVKNEDMTLRASLIRSSIFRPYNLI